MSTSGFDEARVQMRGNRLMEMAESELLGEDPDEAALLATLRRELNSRAIMRDALVVARARDDAEGLSDSEAMYGMAVRGVTTAFEAVKDYWTEEG